MKIVPFQGASATFHENVVMANAIERIKSLYPSAAFHQKAKICLEDSSYGQAVIRWKAYPLRNKYDNIFVGLKKDKLYVYWDYGTLDCFNPTIQTMKSDQAVIEAVMGLAALTKQQEEKDAEFRKSMEEVLGAANK